MRGVLPLAMGFTIQRRSDKYLSGTRGYVANLTTYFSIIGDFTKQALILGLLAFASSPLRAGILQTVLRDYQIGLDYSTLQRGVALTYETDAAPSSDQRCTNTAKPGWRQCSADIDSGTTSGLGVLLEQAFHRQGQFYFKPELSLALRYLEGHYRALTGDSLPLKRVDFELGAVVLIPYLRFGVTPARPWPDFLVSIGPAFQIAGGPVSVNHTTKNVVVGTASGLSGFVLFELVLARFGDGAFSIFSSFDSTGSRGGEFFPGTVDRMNRFRGSFSNRVFGSAFGMGLKLLFDWP